MKYPLEPGLYRKKENGKLLTVIAEEDGLVYCKQDKWTFAVLSEIFVKRFEKVGE